jgi:hypothetical protein
VTGPIEEERLRPWSTVLRVPTDEGLLYFKEPEPALAHEARLLEILARRRPDLVTEVVASDHSGRMLMRDAGPQLSSQPDLRAWEEALPLYAELQISAVDCADELLAAGAFDRRSALLPSRYAELVATAAPGLTGEEYRQLRSLIPQVDDAFGELAASGIPETINNDDMSDATVHVRQGRYRFLDWGDACVSHPFVTLTVTLRIIELRHKLPPASPEIERIQDAYLEPFTEFGSFAELRRLVPGARRFGQICRIALRAEHPSWDDPEELGWSFRLLLDPEAWRAWLTQPADGQPPRSGPVS